MTARLGIMLSGSGTTYASIVAAIAAGTLHAEIAVVIASKASAGGVARAHAFQHPVVITTAAAEITETLEKYRCDLVAMCGWLSYYDPPPGFHGRVLNIHPSLLPHFGGKGMYGIHVHKAVLAAGVCESGCTVHVVSGDYDKGPCVGQARVPVLPDDTPETLQQRVQAAERQLYPQLLEQHIREKIRSLH